MTFNINCPPINLDENPVNKTITNAAKAFESYSHLSLNQRSAVINCVKAAIEPLMPKISKMAVEETGMGNVPDKIVKNLLALYKTPAVEDLVTEVQTGDNGMTLYELSAYGIIAALHPCTNPCATIINNTISMLAAGNAVIHVAHPRAINVSAFLVENINNAISKEFGINKLVSILPDSSFSLVKELINHPDIDMIVATGGAQILRNIEGLGKKTICAGPGNPVAIVDETAHIKEAAKDIIAGASFDNNLMCTSEKSVIAVNSIYENLISCFEANGGYMLTSEADATKLQNAIFSEECEINKLLEGKSANEILDYCGISAPQNVKVILLKSEIHSPFAVTELLMPILPVISADNFETALDYAIMLEQRFRHTATIHSQSIDRLNKAAHKMQTAVFVKNGSSLVGIGFNGEGSTSFTIGTITGEGPTSARHFARRRRCSLTSGFNIR